MKLSEFADTNIAEELYAVADEILECGKVSHYAHDMLADRFSQLVQEHMVRGLLDAENVKVGVSQSQKKAVVRLTDDEMSPEAKRFRLTHLKRYINGAMSHVT